MSKKSREKRRMRLRGEKRVEPDKPAGMAGYMIPGIRMDMLADRLREYDPEMELIDIDDSDPWLGRFEMSEENLDSAGDGIGLMQRLIKPDAVWKEDYATAGKWLQLVNDYGRKTDRCEAELPRNKGAVPGDELEPREVQSRAGDYEAMEKEGSTPAETPDDQS